MRLVWFGLVFYAWTQPILCLGDSFRSKTVHGQACYSLIPRTWLGKLNSQALLQKYISGIDTTKGIAKPNRSEVGRIGPHKGSEYKIDPSF